LRGGTERFLLFPEKGRPGGQGGEGGKRFEVKSILISSMMNWEKESAQWEDTGGKVWGKKGLTCLALCAIKTRRPIKGSELSSR